MIVIFTDNDEIDKTLEEALNGKVISYANYVIEDNQYVGTTLILFAGAIEKNFREYLYCLLEKDIRVILLITNKDDLETKVALEMGIKDLVFKDFYPSEIKKMINNPTKFKDISDVYEKVFSINIKKYKKENGINKN